MAAFVYFFVGSGIVETSWDFFLSICICAEKLYGCFDINQAIHLQSLSSR